MPRLSEVLQALYLFVTASAVSRVIDASITSPKRGVSTIDHSDAGDSFCAGCLTGADRVAAARRAAFLRRKYATRRLRLIRTRSCCPMESLWIENRRNAIRIETDRAFSTKPYGLCSPLPLRRGDDLGEGLESPRRNHSKNPHPPPLLAKEK
jgi:hypothetical protein